MRVLSRTWQMLFKGLAEVQEAGQAARRRRDGAGAHRLCGRPADARRGDPQLSVRTARRRAAPAQRQWRRRPRAAASAPRFDGAARRPARRARAARSSSPRRCRISPRCAPSRPRAPTLGIATFPALIALAGEKRDLADQNRARTRRAAGAIRGRPARDRARAERAQDAGQRSSRKLSEWTGRRWMVVVSAEAGAPTVSSQNDAQRRPSWSRACAPIRWCRRCWRAFPAPRSSACARRDDAAGETPPAGDEPPPDADDTAP